MKLRIASVISIMIANHAVADGAFFESGNEFLAQCSAPQTLGPCRAYVAGALGVMLITGPEGKSSVVLRKSDREDVTLSTFCQPDGLTVNQAHSMVMKYIEETPEDRHISMPFLIYAAFIEAFPCD